LKKYMPITFFTAWIGTLALVGTPFFSGFYSKDAIIEAAHHASQSHGGAFTYAWVCVLLGVFVTAFYSFRLLYLTFHGKERFVVEEHHDHEGDHDAGHGDDHDHHHEPGHLAHAPHESPWVVTVPLILLAIPSVIIAWFFTQPMLFGSFFGSSIVVAPEHDSLKSLGEHFHGVWSFALHGFVTLPFWLAFSGFALATWLYWFRPELPAKLRQTFAMAVQVLERKYGFDELYQALFANGALKLGRQFWKWGDQKFIDQLIVNGSAQLVDRGAGLLRQIQSGYLYHYAFAMILGLVALLGAFVWMK
jgi:NADH-quinone oxidoreductase subunit L